MSEAFAARADTLRAAFDRAFAEPYAPPRAAELDLLAVRVADQAYALSVIEIAQLASGLRVVPLPTPLPELLGLVGLRGEALPVYDLGLLLDHTAHASARPWVAVCADGDRRAGLAFDALEGYHRVPRSALHAAADATRGHLPWVIELEGTARPLASVPSLLAGIRSRCQLVASPKEP